MVLLERVNLIQFFLYEAPGCRYREKYGLPRA